MRVTIFDCAKDVKFSCDTYLFVHVYCNIYYYHKHITIVDML
jgi:hypothetical protein